LPNLQSKTISPEEKRGGEGALLLWPGMHGKISWKRQGKIEVSSHEKVKLPAYPASGEAEHVAVKNTVFSLII